MRAGKRSKHRPVYSQMDLIPMCKALDVITPGALVLEGGAFRSLYTQGLMDYWMLHGINFQTVAGVSAGALGGLSYVSGQVGRSADINIGNRKNPVYVGLGALRKFHGIINLDFIIDFEHYKLDRERLYDSRRRFIAVATNCLTGKPSYFDRDECTDFMNAVKASGSMPFVSPMIYVDGVPHLDGCCSCAIPYQWAMDQGYEKIVVVKTHEHGFRIPKAKEKRLGRRVYLRHKEFAKVLDMSDLSYNRQYDEIDQLAKEGRLFVIEPSQPVTVSRVDGDLEKLGQLYWLGFRDGRETIESLREYLGMGNDSNIIIRRAMECDAQELVDIYSHYVEQTAITFEYEIPSVTEFRNRITSTLARYPYLVAICGGKIVGYAYAGTFHARPAYDWAVETSIYVDKDCRGKGVGKALYLALENELRRQHVINVNACIAYPPESTGPEGDAHLTTASVEFHDHMGYRMVGRFHQCGYKFQTWYDMVWMEKSLGDHPVPAVPFVPYSELD